jgi:hypothetical protein
VLSVEGIVSKRADVSLAVELDSVEPLIGLGRDVDELGQLRPHLSG